MSYPYLNIPSVFQFKIGEKKEKNIRKSQKRIKWLNIYKTNAKNEGIKEII